jgi:hypothetical protein
MKETGDFGPEAAKKRQDRTDLDAKRLPNRCSKPEFVPFASAVEGCPVIEEDDNTGEARSYDYLCCRRTLLKAFALV